MNVCECKTIDHYRSVFNQTTHSTSVTAGKSGRLPFFILAPMSYPAMLSHAQVAKAVNKTAADLACWSIQCAMRGTAPEVGFRGEPLNGHRLAMSGKPLAQGWRLLGSYDYLDIIWGFLKCGYPQATYSMRDDFL